MAAPVILPDFGEYDREVKQCISHVKPPGDPPSLRDLSAASHLVAKVVDAHTTLRVSDEVVVKAEEYKDQLYARRRALSGGVGNQDDIFALLQAIRADNAALRTELIQVKTQFGDQLTQFGVQLAQFGVQLTEIKTELRTTRILAAKQWNTTRGTGVDEALEIVPFRNGTMPPNSLPALTSAAAVLQLNSRQLNEYHGGYLEQAPPRSIEAKRNNILKAIGSPHLCGI